MKTAQRFAADYRLYRAQGYASQPLLEQIIDAAMEQARLEMRKRCRRAVDEMGYVSVAWTLDALSITGGES